MGSKDFEKPLKGLPKIESVFLAFSLVCLWPVAAPAQPKAELSAPALLEPAEGKRQARLLVARLLAQKPEQAVTNTGELRIRDAEGKQRTVPARFAVVPMTTNWLNVYEAAPPSSQPVKLTIVHTEGQPNQYFLGAPGAGPGTTLAPRQLMSPFAGSDFWIADLGLEFLHWPQQRVLRKQMRKGQFCDVLQSTDPRPVPGGYSRVLSWIAVNHTEDIVIVHADAYDTQDRLLKEFDPKKVEKINGVWQLEEMEIRNRQTDTRTRIDFNLDQ